MSEYYSIITDAGAALEAAAAAGGPPVALTQFAVGDGGGAVVIPNPSQVALVNEVYRGSLSSLTTGEQPNVLVAQGIIPMESGGYTIREVGIFTQDGTLYSVSNYPDQVKPEPDSGYAAKLGIEYLLQVSSTSDITLIVSPQDYLTEERANTLYLRIDNNLSEIAAAGAEAQQASRDHLGLGSASTHDAQETVTDATAGRLLINGGWGLGGVGLWIADGTDLHAYFPTAASGFYSSGNAVINSALTNQTIDYIWIKHGEIGTLIEIGYDGRVATQVNSTVGGWFGGIVYSTLNKPTAGDINAVAKTGDTMTGALGMEFNTTGWPGAGAIADQLANGMAPLVTHIYSASGDVYLPLTKAITQSTEFGYASSIDFGIARSNTNKFAQPCITAVNDRGEIKQWVFETNGNAGNQGVIYMPDGNILGSAFYAGNLLSHLGVLVNDVSLGANVWQPRTTGDDNSSDQQVPPGHTMIGLATSPFDSSDTVTGIYYKPIQKYVSGSWVIING